jgi:nucleoside-diphosphate-sugar epimerase
MSFFLISGASGFLGKAIIRQLLLKKAQILTIGRKPTNDIICDLVSESPIFNVNQIDFVIHAAGKAHSFPKTNVEKQAFFDVNLTGTYNLLKSLETLPKLPKYFVFISSVAVYGYEKGTKITELMPLKARDPYGLSKIEAEQLVKDWCSRNNVIWTILRLPLLVGKNPLGNLGAMVTAIRKGYYFNIDDGRAIKSMVLDDDVAYFIPEIALIGGIYNLTDGSDPSVKNLSYMIAKKKIFNLPLNVAKVFGFIGDLLGDKAPINSLKVKKITSDLTFDDSKARKLGWKPQSVLGYLKYYDL